MSTDGRSSAYFSLNHRKDLFCCAVDKKPFRKMWLQQQQPSPKAQRCVPTQCEFDPEAVSHLVAPIPGTEASRALTYYFQPVCSIYLIFLFGKGPIVYDAWSYCAHLFVGEQIYRRAATR